jgi:hypothetical protein
MFHKGLRHFLQKYRENGGIFLVGLHLLNRFVVTAPLRFHMQATEDLATVLNQACYCRTLDPDRLRHEIDSDASAHGLMQSITQTRPHLFSSTAVFLTPTAAQQLADTVDAIERVMALPGYVAQALARAPAIAGQLAGPRGVCMGYDFHIAESSPRLIEINTNAGGLLLNAALLRAQVACCEAMHWSLKAQTPSGSLEPALQAMFIAEWSLQRGAASLKRVAIVDDDPADQYLAPEFELFKQFFIRMGVDAMVVDPSELQWRNKQLWHGENMVDMVYNRLTDFYLEAAPHQALRQAYEAGAVVLTPDPRAHALYADKRNLVVLSNDTLLASWGALDTDRAVLRAAVPQTRLVEAGQAEELWAQRKQLFFKPVAGYGSKATYRGDKLTKRVWGEILSGDFVAQALVAPSERQIKVDEVVTDLKFDIRAYTYAGQVQLLAARMYSGQTTNFRTEGGGFAPVVVASAG